MNLLTNRSRLLARHGSHKKELGCETTDVSTRTGSRTKMPNVLARRLDRSSRTGVSFRSHLRPVYSAPGMVQLRSIFGVAPVVAAAAVAVTRTYGAWRVLVPPANTVEIKPGAHRVHPWPVEHDRKYWRITHSACGMGRSAPTVCPWSQDRQTPAKC